MHAETDRDVTNVSLDFSFHNEKCDLNLFFINKIIILYIINGLDGELRHKKCVFGVLLLGNEKHVFYPICIKTRVEGSCFTAIGIHQDLSTNNNCYESVIMFNKINNFKIEICMKILSLTKEQSNKHKNKTTILPINTKLKYIYIFQPKNLLLLILFLLNT